MLHNLYLWINKNASNNVHFHEGRFWTYNTPQALGVLFPYMPTTKILRVLRNLEEKGLVMRGNYNTNKGDKTAWYALAPSGEMLLRGRGYDMSTISPSLQDAHINIDSKQDKKESKEKERLDMSMVSQEMMPIVKTWIEYKREKKQDYKPIGFRTFYKRLVGLSHGDVTLAKAIVERSISNNYSGLFPLKTWEMDTIKEGGLFDDVKDDGGQEASDDVIIDGQVYR